MKNSNPALSLALAWKPIAAMLALVLLIFGDMLIAPGTFVLGNQTTDMFLQFYSWREFGFGQLGQGHLALWNPHIYGGAPYFGGTQAALLYPSNWLLLFLPLPLAINWSIAVNVWLLGVFTYLWTAYRGLKPLACFLAGVLLMFCGPHFMHVYSGHPVHMASMTWVPVIFLAIDGVLAATVVTWRGVFKWWSLGMFAVAMQIFAGHPQYLFYTAIASGFYVLFAVIQRYRKEQLMGNVVLPFISPAVIFGGGSALAAIQLFTAFQSTAETIRSTKVPFEFAAMFGFPPENLLTLLNPFFFGDMFGQPYWGRCYLWEMSLFVGVAGLAVGVCGLFHSEPDAEERSKKGKKAAARVTEPADRLPSAGIVVAVMVITFIIALGVNTPLFRFLYDCVPGFSKFRGISKFTFQTATFLVLLVAIGFDRILRNPRLNPRVLVGLGIAGVIVLLLSGWLQFQSAAQFQSWLKAIEATRESYLPPAVFGDIAFADRARLFAAAALRIPGLVLIVTAALLYLAPRWRPALALLTLVAVAEAFFFARHSLDRFDTRQVVIPGIRELLEKNPGDYRILNVLSPNSALSIGAQDLWGFDPGVVRRYAEFIGWSQGVPPDQVTQYVNFNRIEPIHSMLRFRFGFVPAENGVRVIEAQVPPMDRLHLVSRYKVVSGRDRIFDALRTLDPRQEVILESSPAVIPTESDSPGTVRLVASSTDWLEVEADLKSPAILLNTDNYTPAWRAVALPGSSQQSYELLPANYTLRAIPLQAGHHRLRIECRPTAFVVGKWVSIVSWVLLLGSVIAVGRRSSCRCDERL